VGFFDRLWKAVGEIEFSDLPYPPGGGRLAGAED
jgi:hypothetical protein